MKERKTFLDDLFAFLDDVLDSGAEVHIVDKSDPDTVVEHVFVPGETEIEDEIELELPFCEDDDIPLCDEDDCGGCPFSDECDMPYDEGMDEEPDMWGIPNVTRVVFSDPATIVFWDDGSKTVVKCMKGERFERYAGFAAACMKKMFGSTSRAKAIMDDLAVEQIAKTPKSNGIPVPDLTEAFTLTQDAHEQAIQEAVNEALG